MTLDERRTRGSGLGVWVGLVLALLLSYSSKSAAKESKRACETKTIKADAQFRDRKSHVDLRVAI